MWRDLAPSTCFETICIELSLNKHLVRSHCMLVPRLCEYSGEQDQPSPWSQGAYILGARQRTNSCANVIDVNEMEIKARSRVESDGDRIKPRLGGQEGQQGRGGV